MQSTHPPVEIAISGDRYLITLSNIHQLLRAGLTPALYEVLALVADAYHCSTAELMRRAVENEVQL